MTIDLNTATLFGTLFMMLLAVIGYFLKGIMKRLEGIESKSMQTALEVAKIEKEVEIIQDEQIRIRNKNLQTEQFFKDFHLNVREAVKPFFDALNLEIKNIHRDIERIEQGK